MTDTKPKDVCDTVDYEHAHVGMSVCVRLQRCRKVLGVCRYSCDSMTREPSPAFSAESLDLILGSRIGGVLYRGSGCAVPTTDRGVPCLPRIGVCCAYRGSGVPCLPRIEVCCAYRGSDVPCLPRIGVCCAYPGSRCAVPNTDRGVLCLPQIGCTVPTADRGVPCLPRIGVCRAYRGSGCAMPTADRVYRARGALHHGALYSMGSKKSGRPQH